MATSSNPALLPESNIRIEWDGTGYIVTLAPVAEQEGATSIQLTLTDGLVAARLFPDFARAGTDVPPPNMPPAISDLTDQTYPAGTATVSIPFDVHDAESAATTLTVTASADDASLLPPERIRVDGSDTSRTLVLQPVADRTGMATVTVTVGDGLLTTVRSFHLTIGSGVPPPPPPPPPAAPFISEIANQTIASSAGYASIPFSIGDADSPPESLTVQAFGDNPGLIPDANMFVDGVTTNRTLILWPPAGRTGTMTVTLRVSDGQASSTRSFTVTLTGPPPNTIPYLSTIPDQVMPGGANSISVPFIASDAETPPEALILVAWSDDPAILPDANISITGTGTNRVLTLSRLAGANGETTVSIIVGDKVYSVVKTFDITIEPEGTSTNTAPFVSPVANQTVPANAGSVSVSLDVGDAESPANTLTIEARAENASLIPDGNISIGGSGTQRTLTFQPAPNLTGTTVLDLKVSDGQLSTATSFLVTVISEPPVDGRLRIQSVKFGRPSAMTVSWSTESGSLYQVLAKDHVDQPYWQLLSPKLVAYGSSLTWTDLSANGVMRFYRVRKIETLSPSPLPPRLLSLTSNRDGDMELRWSGQPGATYRVLAKEGLDQLEWIPISGELVADGPVVSWTDHNAWGFWSQFYRIELLP